MGATHTIKIIVPPCATMKLFHVERKRETREGSEGKDFLALFNESKSNPLLEIERYYNPPAPPTLYCILSAIRPPPSNANASPY